MTELLRMSGIDKAFPGVRALDGVDLTLRAGEVHTLIGENGAGKSTLMKILSGVYRKDAGRILLAGGEVDPQSPADAQRLGISIVHQELSLAPNVTVAENIFVNREPHRFGFIRWQELYRRTSELLRPFGVSIAPDAAVGTLNIATRQVVEIAKALSFDASVLVLDEPTSSLEAHEVETLFRLIRNLKERGLGIIYISHKLDEVFRISDRLTVLRDGRTVATRGIGDTNPPELIRLMVGRTLDTLYPPKMAAAAADDANDANSATAHDADAPVFEVNALTGRGFSDVSFRLERGEILGFAGLIGAGRSETARAIFGIDRADSGEIVIAGRPLADHTTGEAIRAGLAFVPEERKSQGLFPDHSVSENITAASLERFSSYGFIDHMRARATSREYVAKLSIKTPDTERKVSTLSGGTQQKIVIARWLETHPRVLIVDEPTRGIDVGSKSEIHHLLRRLADEGAGIILISSELPEILGMSDRILVFHEGRITGELDGCEATEEAIMTYATDRHDEDRAAASVM